jgi:ABC-2 type transport system permease protein
VTRLVGSELFKLRTTRTFYGVVAGALALVGVIAVGAAAAGTFGPGDRPGGDLLPIASLAQTFALVLGILAVSTEFRHGTITPSLLAVPTRERLIGAKLVAHVLTGLLLGLAAYAMCAAIVSVLLSVRGIDLGVSGSDVTKIIVGGTLAAALYAALGVGLGALVRNQVGAVVGALGWVFIVEPLIAVIPGISDAVQKYGLNGAGNALSATGFVQGSDAVLGQVAGGFLLLAYAAIFVVAGTLVMRRRDVSA